MKHTVAVMVILFAISVRAGSTETQAAPSTPPAPSIILDGVIVAGSPALSVALVRRPGVARGRAVRVGETIYGWTLVSVTAEGAAFEIQDMLYKLFVGEMSAPGQPSSEVQNPEEVRSLAGPGASGREAAGVVATTVSADGWVLHEIERSIAEERLSRELPSILSDTGVTPRVEDGVVRGLRITRMPDGTILSETGLLSGDVLLSINGESVDGTRALIRLYRRLKSEDEIRVVVERQGQLLKLAYAFQ